MEPEALSGRGVQLSNSWWRCLHFERRVAWKRKIMYNLFSKHIWFSYFLRVLETYRCRSGTIFISWKLNWSIFRKDSFLIRKWIDLSFLNVKSIIFHGADVNIRSRTSIAPCSLGSFELFGQILWYPIMFAVQLFRIVVRVFQFTMKLFQKCRLLRNSWSPVFMGNWNHELQRTVWKSYHFGLFILQNWPRLT